MSGAANCELCGERLVDGFDRVGGLSLCRRCFVGDVRRVVDARGWTLWREHAEYNREELEDHTRVYETIVRITVPAEPGLALRCVRVNWWTWLVGLMRTRARSRDPLFEAHVRVWTQQPDRVAEFLRVEGVEGCLMEVLGNLATSWVEIRGGALEVHYVADASHTEGEIVARSCALAHHLQRQASLPG